MVYNIDAKLLKFFKNPSAFRRVQASIGALSDGEFARKFFANQLGDRRYVGDRDDEAGHEFHVAF